jgi:hypothetical protein
MKIDIPYLKGHELAPPRQRFVSHAEHIPLAIRSEPLTGTPYEFLTSFQPKARTWASCAEVSH